VTETNAIRAILGPDVSDEDAAALEHWYANLARGVAAFPQADLKGVTPPLRSTAAPFKAWPTI
jgi:hypothetical protein